MEFIIYPLSFSEFSDLYHTIDPDAAQQQCFQKYLLVGGMPYLANQILATNEKYYIADHGIRESVFSGNMRDINLVFENIVFMELLRRGYHVTVGRAGIKVLYKYRHVKGNMGI